MGLGFITRHQDFSKSQSPSIVLLSEPHCQPFNLSMVLFPVLGIFTPNIFPSYGRNLPESIQSWTNNHKRKKILFALFLLQNLKKQSKINA